MYALQSAIAVTKAMGARWSSVNITTLSISQLFAAYRRVFITLSNTFLTAPVTIELESLRINFSASDLTIPQYLATLGSASLTIATTPATLTPRYVKYSDAFRAGYKVKPVNLLSPNDDSLQDTEKTSLKLTRPNTDMEVFYKNCLVTVNGFFHMTDYDGTNAYVINGNASRLRSRQNQIGIVSFRNVGNIECVPITNSMMYAQEANADMRIRTYIKLNRDITNKTVMLVLGGYLLFLDGNSFFQTGNDVFALNFNRMPFIERFLESSIYLNFTELNLPVSTDNPAAISVTELMSDTILKRYLKLRQTFFVILDSPELFINRIPIKATGLPGMFITYSEPAYPLIVTNGKVAEYWKTFEDGQWAVNVKDSYLRNRVASTIPRSALRVIQDTDVPEKTFINSQGYLLEMGRDLVHTEV